MIFCFIVIFILLNFSFGYLSNTRIYNKKNLKFYMNNKNSICDFINNDMNNNDIQYIGLFDNFDPNNFYIIIGNKNLQLKKLINDMEDNNLTGIFLLIEYYNNYELENIINQYINCNHIIKFNLKKKLKNKNYNDFLIFNQYEYIGGLFEFYSIIYKNH